MSKLFVEDRNNNRVPVAELELISGKEQAVLGNAQRDLILRTAGNVKVQVGNKFFDLLALGNGDLSTGSNSTIILTDLDDLQSIQVPADGTFIYLTALNSLYIVSGGLYKLITSTTEGGNSGAQKVYLSFSEQQTLTGDNKYQVALNLGSIVDTFADLLVLNSLEVYPNQLIFVVDEQRHYLYSGGDTTDPASWSQPYVHRTGGTVNGSLVIENVLSVNQNYENSYFDSTIFRGFFIGANTTRGLAIWNNDDINIAAVSGASTIKFLTNASDPSNTLNPLIIGGNSVGIGGSIDYGYRLSVSGNTLLNTVDIGDTLSSTNYIAGLDGVGYSLYGSVEKTLEIDHVIVRKSLSVTNSTQYESKGVNGSYISGNEVIVTSVEIVGEYLHYLNQNKVGLALADGTAVSLYDRYDYYYGLDTAGNYGLQQSPLFGDRDVNGILAPYTLYNINPDDGSLITPQGKYSFDGVNNFIEDPGGNLVLFTISTYKIKLTRNDIQINDLLIYKRWGIDGDVVADNYLLVYDIIDEDVYVYATKAPLLNDKFVHIHETLIQYDIDSIDLVDNISNFADIIYAAYYEDTENPDGQLLTYTTEFWDEDIRTKIGNLKSTYDIDLAIPNDTVGFYSDNAYIRGNFVAERLLAGDLTYINGVVTIADLEVLKGRTITGTSGLGGGGNLFNSNLTITHDATNWVNKTNLSGGLVISNLNIDSFGHPTDWVTRTLTSSDITEGSRLYYTDARVDARITAQKGVANGIVPLTAAVKIDPIYLDLPPTVDIEEVAGVMEFRVGGVTLMKLDNTGLYLKTGIEVYPNNF